MKFSTREDIQASIENVFIMLSDFEAYERGAMRRGADVRRLSASADPVVGLSWEASFQARGKKRDVKVVLSQYDMPNGMVFDTTAKGLQTQLTLDLVALSRTRTRLTVGLELKPNSIPARLFIQSLKLGKTRLNKRYKDRVALFAKDLEDRFSAVA